MAASYAFAIEGIEPLDIDLYGEAARRQFWRKVVEIGLAVKDAELAAGKDRFGFKLRQISKWTRAHRRSWTGHADPSAPPLTPAYGESRTRALLDGRAFRDKAQFFWRADPVSGGHWGRILGYHRVGAKNHWAKSGRLPVRDVIGISPKDLGDVKKKVWAWWATTFRGKPETKKEIAPKPKPQAIVPLPMPAPAFRRQAVPPTVQVVPEPSRRRPGEVIPPRGPARPAPKPRSGTPARLVRPKPARRSTKIQVYEETPKPNAPARYPEALDMRFKPAESAIEIKSKTVLADVGALEAAWRRNPENHIPPGGASDKNKYANAVAFLQRAKAEDLPVNMPQITIDKDGAVHFSDGRHRFAALRDMGAEAVPVSVDRTQAKRARRILERPE